MIYDKRMLDLVANKAGPRTSLGRLMAKVHDAARSIKRGENGPVMERPERLRDGRMLLPVPRRIARQLTSRG